jgi:hypothetical protein
MADTWAVKKKPEDEELSLEELMGGSSEGELSLEELTGAAPARPKPTGKMDPLRKATAQLTTGFDLGGFNLGAEGAAAVATGIDNIAHLMPDYAEVFLGGKGIKSKPKTYRQYLDIADANADEYNERRQLSSDDEASIPWDDTGNLASNAIGIGVGAAPYGMLFKGGNMVAQGVNRLGAWAAPKLAQPIMEQGVKAAARIAPRWFETGAGLVVGGTLANKANEIGAVRLDDEERQVADAANTSRIPNSAFASSTPPLPTFGLDKAARPLLETLVVGGAEGLGGGLFGQALGRAGRFAGEHLTPSAVKSAARTLARQIYEAGHTVDDIATSHADNLKIDPKATLDVAGPQGSEFLQRTAATAARGGGGPLEEFTQLTRARQATHSRDVAAATEKALGAKGGSFKSTLADLSERQATEANAAYNAANAAPKLSSPVISEILHRPTIKPVFEQALQRAMDSGKPESAFITRDANGMITEISTELVNIVKKRLDASAGIASKAGDGDTSGYFKQMRRQLVAAADELNPLYAKARKLWAGEEEMQEALEAGFKAFGQGREEVAHAMRQYADNPSLMETFVTGFGQKASKSSLDTSEEGNAVIKMLGNANKQDSFRQLMGDEAYELYVKTMDLKSKQYRSFFEGKKQSATDVRRNESEAMAAESKADLLEGAFNAALNPMEAIQSKGMAGFLNYFRGFDTAKRGYIIRWLLSPDPKLQKQALDAIRKEFEWAKAGAEAAQRGEGLGGSIVNTAGRPVSAAAFEQGQ